MNIEIKNGIFACPGIEAKIVDMVHEYGVKDSVKYSTFYADSLRRVHEFDSEVELGVLGGRVSDCLYRAMGVTDVFINEPEISTLSFNNLPF